jgi:acetyltransferase-like isoleucine patch superfamily enzyme
MSLAVTSGMNETVYRSLDSFLSWFKGYEYRFDRSVPLTLLLGIVLRRSIWLLRGAGKCLLLQHRFRLVYMSPKVNLRNASLIHFGKGVTLERGVIIDGLSSDGMKFGDNVVIGPYSVVRASSPSNVGAGVRMGSNSAVDAYSFIGASGFVDIGKDVIMGQHVSFHAENHNYDRTDIPIKHQGTHRQGIVIEDDCWVGSNVIFLDGVHVGRGCVIGAGSVVRGRIPPYTVAAGVPARALKSRLTVGTESSGTAEIPAVKRA